MSGTPLGRVLIIAGSDSGGGAGVQADIKTVTVLGGYAASAITAVTVQNTLGVSAIHPIPAEVVEAQARAVLDDIGADAIKTGMLGGLQTVEAVARVLGEHPAVPAVIDPVMIAKGGASLLEHEAVAAVRERLLPLAALVTPNAPEAEALTGLQVRDLEGQRRAGEALLRAGAKAALVKGGHVRGDVVKDLLVTAAGERVFETSRIPTRHTHGTGCTLASACATGLAQGLGLEAAVARAIAYTTEAIRRAPGFGLGHGPLGHGWPLSGQGLSSPGVLEQRLCEIVRSSPRLMQVLTVVRDLGLPDWRVASGAIFQSVWNALTGRDPDHGIKDYDVLYFDPDVSWEAEDAVIRRVGGAFEPPLRELVEVRNQARVPLWFEARFGEPYAPLTCTDEAISRFLSPANCVGVRLDADDRLDVVAPFGLEDCFAMRLRPNPSRPRNPENFRLMCESLKRRWPELVEVPAL